MEEAGYTAAEIPDRFDPFIDFFKSVQDRLRAKGMHKLYGCGFTVSTTGFAPTGNHPVRAAGAGGRAVCGYEVGLWRSGAA